MFPWSAFTMVTSAILASFCEGQYSICQYHTLTFGGSPLVAWLESDSETVLVNSANVVFQSPLPSENISSRAAECFLHVRGGGIVQLNVTTFDLGGRDPCSINEEHLSIAFYSFLQPSNRRTAFGFVSNRGDGDTVRWCGRSHSRRLETRQELLLRYFAGSPARRGQGFVISFAQVSQFWCGEDKEDRVGEQPMYVYSPGYPDMYSNELKEERCTWSIRSKHGNPLLLESLRFDVELHPWCNYDSLTINGEKYCGNQRIRMTSSRDYFQISFSSDHLKQGEGFVLKVVETEKDVASCQQQVLVGTAPVLLRVPALAPQQRVSCWWLLDSGSDDSVVLLETTRFNTSGSCAGFELTIYDGKERTMSSQIPVGCDQGMVFGTLRSSSRYLHIDIDVNYYGPSPPTIDVLFTATNNPRDTLPRVLYASFAESYIWLNTSVRDNLGFLVRGSEEDVGNYSTCLHLSLRSLTSTGVNYNTSDHLLVFSGWNSSFAELGRACGRISSEILITRGSKASVQCVGTDQPNTTTLWLIYRLRTDYCDPMPVRLRSSSQFVQNIVSDRSLAYSGNILYPANLLCRWMIEAEGGDSFIQVTSTYMQLYPPDNLTAFDYKESPGVKTTLLLQWRDDKSVVFSAKGSNLLLQFASGINDFAGRFVLNYTSVYVVNQCPSMAILTAEDTEQYVTSPNYPYNYPKGMDCQWLIRSETGVIQLNVTSIAIVQEITVCSNADFLIIYDGEYSSGQVLAELCGLNISTRVLVSSARSVLVHFHSRERGTAAGFFRLAYQSVYDSGMRHCNFPVFVTEDVDSYVTSPFFPNPYPRNTDCFWLVMAPLTHVVMLEVLNMDLPCDSAVTLFDGQSESGLRLAHLCGEGSQKRQYVSSGKSMYVRFTAASSNDGSYTGFRFRLRSWKSDESCQGSIAHLMAYTSKRYITTPGYPATYPPNTDCQWRIESAVQNMSVLIEIEDGQLQGSVDCQLDRLSVYDGYGEGSRLLGKYCTEGPWEFRSSQSYLFLHFVSDSSSTGSYRGFSLAYQAVSISSQATQGPEANKSGSSASVIVGGVLGGVAFLVLMATAFLCYLRRCHHVPSSSSTSQATSSSSSFPRGLHFRCSRRGRGGEGGTVFVMNPIILNQLSLPPPPYPGLPPAHDLPPPYQPAGPALSFPLHLDAPPSYSESVMEARIRKSGSDASATTTSTAISTTTTATATTTAYTTATATATTTSTAASTTANATATTTATSTTTATATTTASTTATATSSTTSTAASTTTTATITATTTAPATTTTSTTTTSTMLISAHAGGGDSQLSRLSGEQGTEGAAGRSDCRSRNKDTGAEVGLPHQSREVSSVGWELPHRNGPSTELELPDGNKNLPRESGCPHGSIDFPRDTEYGSKDPPRESELEFPPDDRDVRKKWFRPPEDRDVATQPESPDGNRDAVKESGFENRGHLKESELPCEYRNLSRESEFPHQKRNLSKKSEFPYENRNISKESEYPYENRNLSMESEMSHRNSNLYRESEFPHENRNLYRESELPQSNRNFSSKSEFPRESRNLSRESELSHGNRNLSRESELQQWNAAKVSEFGNQGLEIENLPRKRYSQKESGSASGNWEDVSVSDYPEEKRDVMRTSGDPHGKRSPRSYPGEKRDVMRTSGDPHGKRSPGSYPEEKGDEMMTSGGPHGKRSPRSYPEEKKDVIRTSGGPSGKRSPGSCPEEKGDELRKSGGPYGNSSPESCPEEKWDVTRTSGSPRGNNSPVSYPEENRDVMRTSGGAPGKISPRSCSSGFAEVRRGHSLLLAESCRPQADQSAGRDGSKQPSLSSLSTSSERLESSQRKGGRSPSLSSSSSERLESSQRKGGRSPSLSSSTSAGPEPSPRTGPSLSLSSTSDRPVALQRTGGRSSSLSDRTEPSWRKGGPPSSSSPFLDRPELSWRKGGPPSSLSSSGSTKRTELHEGQGHPHQLAELSSQDHSPQDQAAKDRLDPNRSAQDRSSQDRSAQNGLSQEQSYQDYTLPDRSAPNRLFEDQSDKNTISQERSHHAQAQSHQHQSPQYRFHHDESERQAAHYLSPLSSTGQPEECGQRSQATLPTPLHNAAGAQERKLQSTGRSQELTPLARQAPRPPPLSVAAVAAASPLPLSQPPLLSSPPPFSPPPPLSPPPSLQLCEDFSTFRDQAPWRHSQNSAVYWRQLPPSQHSPSQHSPSQHSPSQHSPTLPARSDGDEVVSEHEWDLRLASSNSWESLV